MSHSKCLLWSGGYSVVKILAQWFECDDTPNPGSRNPSWSQLSHVCKIMPCHFFQVSKKNWVPHKSLHHKKRQKIKHFLMQRFLFHSKFCNQTWKMDKAFPELNYNIQQCFFCSINWLKKFLSWVKSLLNITLFCRVMLQFCAFWWHFLVQFGTLCYFLPFLCTIWVF